MAGATQRTAQTVAVLDEDEEERLEPVETGEERQVETAGEEGAEEQQTGDERLGGGEEADDARAAADEERKERNRRERKERKERQERAKRRLYEERAHDRNQIAALQQQIADLSRQVHRTDVSTIDSQLTDVDARIEQASFVMARAQKSTAATAEADYVQAQRIRDDLIEARTNLRNAKRFQEQRAQQQERPQPPPPPSEVVRQAQAFARENPWYQPGGRTREGQIADRISVALDTEGYDPESQEYWDELRARCERHPSLAHVYESDDEDGGERRETRQTRRTNGNSDTVEPGARRSRGGPRMSSGGREQPLRPGEMYIPPEMKAYMQETGQWDDPKRRNAVLKEYREQQRAAQG